MSVKEKRTNIRTLGEELESTPSSTKDTSIPRKGKKVTAISTGTTNQHVTKAKVTKTSFNKSPKSSVLAEKLDNHLSPATTVKERMLNYSLTGEKQSRPEEIPDPVKFINKRNNYSDSIQEFDLEKDIEEDKYRRRSSIIEQNDKLIDQWHKLQKIAFEKTGDAKIYQPNEDPRDFNVLWRGYVKVLNQACEKTKENSENNKEDKEEDITSAQEDPELELFDEMSTKEKIMKLNVFLRSEIYYCCYCGIKYKSEQELYENCPGIKQEDHE